MKLCQRLFALLLCLLLPFSALTEEEKLPLQDVHRVKLTKEITYQQNGARIYQWYIDTVQDAVDDELNGIAQTWREEMLPTVKKPPANSYSWLYVTIRYSRTGLTWMSFMVQARNIYDKIAVDGRFTTRTYDMSTGERVMLTDIFPEDSEAWALLQNAVREQVNAYYPDLTADSAALEAACSREAIEQMDFTLHGMSLVLHLYAADFYPGKEQLIEVTLYYPELRPLMTEKAQIETDNLTYYNTIALTYDDGPTGVVTRDMLNMLLENGVRATFFLVGDRMESGVYLVMREHDEGHTVATHNYHHVMDYEVSEETLLEMAEQVRELHLEMLGLAPTIARAPGGSWKNLVSAGVGWPLIHWTLHADDWDGENGRDPVAVFNQIVANADDGEIILMHDLKENSIEASEMFIQYLQEKGFIFLTVEELFAKDGVTLEPDQVYYRCQDGVVEAYN